MTRQNFSHTYKGDRIVKRHTVALAFVVVSVIVAVMAFGASAAVSPKGVTGYFGSTGASAGQMSTPRGVAVNQTSGNVYAVDGFNNRVVEFSSSGEFLRTFGQDVVESGPDNNGTGFEICVPASGDVCKVGNAGATGGAMTTAEGIAIDQSTGNLYVTEANNQRVQEFDSNGKFLRAFGQDVVATGSPDNSPATSAVQTLTVTATGGKYTLEFQGHSTPELSFNATASSVQTALQALPTVGSGNVTVAETSAGVYAITFAGALANNPEPLIVAASAAGEPLTGGTSTIVNTRSGATGFEVCVAANNDVCQKGASASTGGAFGTSLPGYPAVAPVGAPNAGDVLIADSSDRRVQEFSPNGAFVRAFGFDVVAAGPDNNGSSSFEVCNAASYDACKIAGASGSGVGQFATSTPQRVVEDATGAIYTVEASTNFRVQKFTLPSNVVTPQGGFDEADLKGTSAATSPTDVAVDPTTGDLLVTKAFAAGATVSCPATGLPSVAERRVLEVSSAGALQATHMACAGINAGVSGLAMRASASTGDIYVASTTTESRLYVLNTPLAAPTVGFSGVSGVTAHSATVSGYANPNGPVALPYGLHTSYHVSYKRSTDATFTQAPNVDVDLGKGTNSVIASQQLVGLEANTSYEVQIVVTKPFGVGTVTTSIYTFTTPPTGAEVTTPTATTAPTETGAEAALSGAVSSNSQATSYRFEYGTSTAYGTNIPVSNGSVAAGPAATPVAQYISNLLPSTTYHFRLVAKNVSGGVLSPDQTFTTPPAATGNTGHETCTNEELRHAQGSAGLPDCRAYEQVSPADKGANGVVEKFSGLQTTFQAAPDGNSVYYSIFNGLTNATAGGEDAYMAQRDPSGWTSNQVTAPTLIQFPAGSHGGNNTTSYIRYNSNPLSCSVLESVEPLTEDTPVEDVQQGVINLYRKNSDGTYTLISNTVPLNPILAELGGNFRVAAASSSCNQILFESGYQLLPSAVATPSLYEWNDGTLRLVGVLPDGHVATGEVRAGGPETTVSSMSADGSRVFFSANSDSGAENGREAIFLRRNGSSTVDISQSQTALPSNGAYFQGALPDGSHVYFRDRYGLASKSSSGPMGTEDCKSSPACDLYDYNVDTETLTDLSVDTNPADSKGASVAGMVDVSEDGSYVYFAATGQLVPGQGHTEAQNVAKQEYNVFLNHNGQILFVGLIASGEVSNANTGADLSQRFGTWAADATPDGRHLLFVSKANVTGYGEGVAEAYLYSADSNTTVCISCRPDGIAGKSAASGPIQFKGNPEWGSFGRGEPYRPRAISSDGSRVFFTSPDPLVPGADSGVNNIYEWDKGQIYLLAAQGNSERRPVFVDSSESGNDAFFTSAVKLVPQDFDLTNDLYDARVGGGFAYVPSAPACDVLAHECQQMPPAPPLFTEPPSLSFSGPGNQPASLLTSVVRQKTAAPRLTRAQKLARALRACRKKKSKKKRLMCEKTARTTYRRSK